LGCWISPCYGTFSFVARFETSELFISLIFTFFMPRETADTESVDTVARLYTNTSALAHVPYVRATFASALRIGIGFCGIDLDSWNAFVLRSSLARQYVK
jgi:hypothetical protein